MSLITLNVESIPSAIAKLNEELELIKADVIKRPYAKAARSVSLTIQVAPDVKPMGPGGGHINAPMIAFTTKHSIPGHASATYRSHVREGAKGKWDLVISEDAALFDNDDPAQTTISDAIAERSAELTERGIVKFPERSI